MSGIETLSSRANERVKAAAALKDAAARKKTGLFLLEGARLCADAAQFGAGIAAFYATPAAAAAYASAFDTVSAVAEKTFYITDAVAEKLSDTVNSQKLFCVCSQKNAPLQTDPAGSYLMTDRIQDPENLGALARTAEAFGASGLIVSGGCDIYSPKALRASMGALLRFPVMRAPDPFAAVEAFRGQGMRVVAAVLRPDAADIRTLDIPGGKVLLIGNEGSGVDPRLIDMCTDYTVIPMAGRAESLNAAAAGAVLLWEMIGRERGNQEWKT